jgi:hypothetical protein
MDRGYLIVMLAICLWAGVSGFVSYKKTSDKRFTGYAIFSLAMAGHFAALLLGFHVA